MNIPEWRQMLASPDKLVERWLFRWITLIIIVLVWILDILPGLNLPMEAYLGLLLTLLFVHAIAERTAREELSEQLKAPRAFFLKDRGAVYQAAAELLQRAREHPAATEIILTNLRVPRWPGGETTPETERFMEEKMRILREGRIPVRHIFNLPDESSLERLLEAEPRKLAEEGKGQAFLVKAFARGGDLPHIDVGAARGVGVIFAFPDPRQRAWNAAGVRIDDPEIAEMAFRYFDALWEDRRGFLIFDRGDLKEEAVEALRRALRGEEKIRILDNSEALYQAAGDVIQKSQRIRIQALGRPAAHDPEFSNYRDRVLERLQDVQFEFRRMTGSPLNEEEREYLNQLAQHPNVALKGYPGVVNVPTILIGDQEIIIAFRDMPQFELRRGVMIRDEDIAAGLREWFDYVLWGEPSAILLKDFNQTGLLPGALERLERTARGGVEVVLDRNRDGAAYRRAREVIEQLVGPRDEILAFVTYEGAPPSSDQMEDESEGYRQEREAYYRTLLNKVHEGAAYRRIFAFRHREGRVAPGYVSDPVLGHAREMLRLQSEPRLRDLISLHRGEMRLDLHSFVVIPGKAALVSLDRPQGPYPSLDGVLVFYQPPHADLIRYLEEIWRNVLGQASRISEVPEREMPES